MFWDEAINTSGYTQNRSIIMKRHGMTAYELLKGRTKLYLIISCFWVCLLYLKSEVKADD